MSIASHAAGDDNFCAMPLIDKPLEELKHYRGISPVPADFDAYWTAALRELDATAPEPELVPSDAIRPPHAECFDLWFRGVGGAKIYAKYVRPKNRTGPGPVPYTEVLRAIPVVK